MTCFLLIESHKSDFNPITGTVVCTRCQDMSPATLSRPDILVQKVWVHKPIYNSQKLPKILQVHKIHKSISLKQWTKTEWSLKTRIKSTLVTVIYLNAGNDVTRIRIEDGYFIDAISQKLSQVD